MTDSSTGMSRRAALATLGSAGFGLWGMRMPFIDKITSTDPVQVLSTFKEPSRQRLNRLLFGRDSSAFIPVSDAEALCASENKDIDALMLALLPVAATYARAPISNFLVGSVARGVSGNLYLGGNLEVPHQALGFSVHGEQSVIANAYMHGDEGITAIAGTDAPCGHCRQFMNELSPGRDIQVNIQGSPTTRLSVLLPASFGPKDLGGEGAFPVRRTALVAPKGQDDALTAAAFDAACKSYAPYSKSPSGAGISVRGGRVFTGSYIENAAFNPSLPPLQTALLALIAAGESFSSISKVALVEVEGAMITQKNVTEAALGAIAPSIALRIALARRS